MFPISVVGVVLERPGSLTLVNLVRAISYLLLRCIVSGIDIATFKRCILWKNVTSNTAMVTTIVVLMQNTSEHETPISRPVITGLTVHLKPTVYDRSMHVCRRCLVGIILVTHVVTVGSGSEVNVLQMNRVVFKDIGLASMEMISRVVVVLTLLTTTTDRWLNSLDKALLNR